MSEQGRAGGELAALADQLAAVVERVGQSVVRVEGRRRQSASGLVWSAGGLILTADHVVERDEALGVGLPDGREVEATLAGRDPATDLALLRVNAQELTPLPPSPEPRLGELAVLVARPSGLESSLGSVSALGADVRTRRGGRIEAFVRTDAVMYPGFSGGALVDASGRLIGLATSHFSQGPEGIALREATLRRVAGSLEQHGRVKRGYLGVGSQRVEVPSRLSGLVEGQNTGLLVVSVEEGGPAEQAGVLLGDLLVSLGEQALTGHQALRAALGSEVIGQQTKLVVLRAGERRELTISPGEAA
jgi:S1-C subfamily serine protease